MIASEQSIHERVWALYQAYRDADAVMWHIANEGIRGPRERAKFKAMGGVPGVPDFFCAARQRAFFLELKRPHGRLSPDQKDLIDAHARQGLPTLVAFTVYEAARLLQIHGVLRSDVTFSCGPSERGAQGGSEVSASDPSTGLEASAAA